VFRLATALGLLLSGVALAQNPPPPGTAQPPMNAQPPVPWPGFPGAPPTAAPPSLAPPAVAPPAVARPAAPRQIAAPSGVASPVAARTPLRPDELVDLIFPNTDVKEVLNFYERLTGKRLVIDNGVQGTVNIVVAGRVPLEEAVRIIEINLLLNGFTLVPAESKNIVKVIGGGKSPRAASIPIISDELLLPEGEQVVTFLAKLQYADPVEIQQMLTTFIAQAPGQYTNFTPLPKSQAMLITENSATIRGVLKVLREIDVPPLPIPVVSEFLPLERADASDVLEKLTAIFEKPGAPGTTVSRTLQRAIAASAPGAPPLPGVTGEGIAPGTLEIRGGALSEDSIIVGKIKLTADVRTNRIHVVTRPENMDFVRKLVTEFDSVAVFGEPISRPLKFISVGDVIDVVVKAISEPGMKEGGGGGGTTGSTSRSGTSSGSGGGGIGGGGGFGSGADGGGGGGGSAFSVDEGLSTEAVDTKPDARIVGQTRIIADKNANAIIVMGSADAKAKIFRLLDKLDQRIPQVMLHTVIGELNLNEREQFGVDYIIRTSGLGVSPIVLNGGTGTNGGNGTTNGGTSDGTGTGIATGGTTGTTTTTSTTGRNTSDFVSLGDGRPVLNLNNLLDQNSVRGVLAAGGSGLAGFVTAGNSMTAIVTALENTNRFRVVSRPSVFTRNNKKAIIASGQEIAVPTSIQSSLTPTSGVGNQNGIVSNSSVQFKRVALQLEVVPLINSDREVSLDILQKVDEVSGSTRVDNNDIPNIATRYVKTSVTVPNEGTLVLGGLIKQSQNKARTGIPLLSSIPVLGYLFSTTTKEKIRTELVILIRPVVSWAPPEAVQIRERAQEFLNIDPDLEASLYPLTKRHVAPSELPVATPLPKKPAKSAAPFRQAGTPAPAKRAAASPR
jgi:type II secretion system protein D